MNTPFDGWKRDVWRKTAVEIINISYCDFCFVSQCITHLLYMQIIIHYRYIWRCKDTQIFVNRKKKNDKSLKNVCGVLTRVYGPIQSEKWKMKSEKGVRRGSNTNWEVKNESYPSGAANFHLSTFISSNSQFFKVPRCWSRQCIMSTSIVLVFRKSRYGYKNSLICKCANSLIDSHINTFTHSHVRSFLSY